MANPNLLTATSIYGNLFPNTINSSGGIVTTETFSNPAGSNKILNIKNILIQGSSGSTGAYFRVVCEGLWLYSNIGTLTIAATSIINKNTQIYLQENQSITFSVYGPLANVTTLNYLISYEEIS